MVISSHPQSSSHHCPSSEQLRAFSNILSIALSGRPPQSQQPGFFILPFWTIFMFLWIWLLFIHKTHTISSLFSNWAVIWSHFLKHFTFSCIKTKNSGNSVKLHLPNFFSLLTIADCELWWFDIFDSPSLVQPIRLFEPF